MNIIDINLWSSYIKEQLQSNKNIYATCTMLSACIFKSKRTATNSIALWNDDTLHLKSVFSKVSFDKQMELCRHTIFKIPFIFTRKISISDILTLFDTSGGSSHILGFLSCTTQGFPVYNDIQTHKQIVINYIKCMFQNSLKAHFSDYVHIINGECYISAELLRILLCDDAEYLQCINEAPINEIHTVDISSDTWDVCILERDMDNWCTFVINARRSVLKDFSLCSNCICSSIDSVEPLQLNRSEVLKNQPHHIITVFDIKSTISMLQHSLCECETLDILDEIQLSV